jgi:hypothetical protein
MTITDRESPSSERVTLSRRMFVGASPILVAALTSCAHSLLDQTRIADSFIVDPDWAAYRPVLRGIIRVVLPLDRPDFPKLTLDEIETRLVTMFPIDREQRFLGLQRALMLFDQVDLFPIVSAPLVTEEAKARDTDGTELVTLLGDDAHAYAAFAAAHSIAGPVRFTALPAMAQREYFLLWRDSASIVKRSFYASMRALAMLTVYSADAAWSAIGYEGPLLHRPSNRPSEVAG